MDIEINKEKLERVIRIAKTILKDLYYFGENAPRPQSNISYINKWDGSRDAQFESSMKVAMETTELLKTAFVAYLRLLVNGEEEIWYFTRFPLSIQSRKKTIRYKRTQAFSELFAQQVGVEYLFKPVNTNKKGFHLNDFKYKIIEKNIFRSINYKSIWDAINNSIELGDEKISPESLKNVLKTYYPNTEVIELIADENFMEEIIESLQTESSIINAGIYSGFKRQSIEKAELKDIAILNDIFQEKAFRQPLSSRIILTGIAGTGKTSVLIKRVAQHIDYEFITEEDKKIVKEKEIELLFNDFDSWIAFSPNKKVMSYLKEAFDKDNVVVSGRQLKTWDAFKKDFLYIIKLINDEENPEGKFYFTEDSIIKINNNNDLIKYSIQFDKFVYTKFKNIIQKAKRSLSKCPKTKEISDLLKILSIKKSNGKFSYQNNYLEFFTNIYKSYSLLVNINNMLDNEIQELMNNATSKNQNILNLTDSIINKDYDKLSEENINDLFNNYNSKIKKTRMFKNKEKELKKFLSKEIKKYCIHLTNQKNIQRNSFNVRFVEYVLKDIPFKRKSKRFNILLDALSSLSFIRRQYSNIINNIPHLYIEFRRSLIKSKSKCLTNYALEDIKANKLSNEEIDLIIFQILRNTKWIFNYKYSIFEKISSNKLIEKIKEMYRTQVLIDEIADFSTLQIGSMFSISHPKFNSLFLTGDLMQRVEEFGLSSWNELEYLSSDFKTFELKKVYRHTQKMLKLIRVLYEKKYNQQPDFESVYPVDEREPNPLLYKYVNNNDHYNWIINRLVEIFHNKKNRLLSTAIFVPSEDLIDITFEKLSVLMKPTNEVITFNKCFGGELSKDINVKILSIEYIKGYEFESVFILDIDKISIQNMPLIDNLLYVAITRAAAYLGITYSKEFPKKIDYLKNYLTSSDWNI